MSTKQIVARWDRCEDGSYWTNYYVAGTWDGDTIPGSVSRDRAASWAMFVGDLLSRRMGDDRVTTYEMGIGGAVLIRAEPLPPCTC